MGFIEGEDAVRHTGGDISDYRGNHYVEGDIQFILARVLGIYEEASYSHIEEAVDRGVHIG
jgi:hypothetical protein